MTTTHKVRLMSIKVGDAVPGEDIEALIHDLEDITHAEAVAHYGSRPNCRYTVWTRGESSQGRDLLVAFLSVVEDGDRHLREFDEAKRPVAIAHWWEVDAP